MVPQPLYTALQHAVETILGSATAQFGMQPVGGGSINQCFKITAAGRQWFCKANKLDAFPRLFETERQGLQLLAQQQVIGVPAARLFAVEPPYQILVLEWIEPGREDNKFWKLFGAQLAALHQRTAPQFGLDHDNYIGSVPQSNRQADTWTRFFAEQRLQPMVERCRLQQLLPAADIALFEKLYRKLEDIFADRERPCLLHGDLWSGNFICSASGQPYLVDPAASYGHRSADLAMTTLFGGFDKSFYESYDHHYPFPPQYKEQWKVCNLYPLLIHLLLFGKSYLRSIQQTLREFAQ